MKRTLASTGSLGGRAIRRLKLLGNIIQPRAEIPGEVLLEVPLRQRLALEGSGYVKFYEAPLEVANKDEGTGKKAVTTQPKAKAKAKTKVKAKAKTKVKRKSRTKAGSSKKKGTTKGTAKK